MRNQGFRNMLSSTVVKKRHVILQIWYDTFFHFSNKNIHSHHLKLNNSFWRTITALNISTHFRQKMLSLHSTTRIIELGNNSPKAHSKELPLQHKVATWHHAIWHSIITGHRLGPINFPSALNAHSRWSARSRPLSFQKIWSLGAADTLYSQIYPPISSPSIEYPFSSLFCESRLRERFSHIHSKTAFWHMNEHAKQMARRLVIL